MTLPNPGVPLSISQIAAEFPGGTNPAGLNEYYAGGPYVPAGTTGYYGPIPSSGTISIRNFYGATNGFFIAGSGGSPIGSFPYNNFIGAYSGITGIGSLGTFLRTTITVGATTYTVRGVYDVYFGDFTTTSSYFIFAVTGNRVGTWWSTITVNGITYSRATDCSPATGTYTSSDNVTYWQPGFGLNKRFNLSNGVTYGLTVT